VAAPDLVAAAGAAKAAGLSVVLVEQPYRVAGRRSPAPAQQLDAAWVDVTSRLQKKELRGLPLIVGGRSLGARVACRTSGLTGAIGVVCLAFPLRPPGREVSRLEELEAVTEPVLVVQGSNDPFGIPPSGENRRVIEVAGDHGLKADLPAVAAAVGGWLETMRAATAR
jgi:predicted alpha/beta-hydrolase family hydrolase